MSENSSLSNCKNLSYRITEFKTSLINYVLGGSEKETERLNIQSALFEREAIQTLDLAGLKQGMRCLDAGCGVGHTSLLMSKLVGKSGKVVGLDINENNIDVCKQKLNRVDDNLEFLVGDLHGTTLKDSSFDFVYSRFLFQHLTDPEKALLKISKLTTDEGIIAIEELDHGLWLSYPHNPHLRKLQRAYMNLLKLSGSDPFIARKLYGMFLKAGMRPNVAAYSVCVRMNDNSFNMLGVLMAEVLKESILNYNLMTHLEFDQMFNGLKKYALDPTGLVLYAIAFRIWAKKTIST
ncbi:MAG TPA: methyltransferase domain-containing protein [Candidatus Bathyarchaeia archaeon]|nr:methyltransferase domain-containing protein [Candidatus Bathyarchaeia archaeon]